MSIPESTTAPAPNVTLEAHLDQIDAAVNEAHQLVEKMKPVSGDESATPESPGAVGTALRIERKLRILNDRLSALADIVGSV